MSTIGIVYLNKERAGKVWQDENGYGFSYDAGYLALASAVPVSLTLPLREDPYLSNSMIPFFDGLIPEGWILDIALDNWKIDERDRMELLLVACRDCIGAVSIVNSEESK